MTLKIVEAPVYSAQKEVIELLEELLTLARDGDICNMVFVAEQPTGVFKVSHRGDISTLKTLGAISMMKHFVCQSSDEKVISYDVPSA